MYVEPARSVMPAKTQQAVSTDVEKTIHAESMEGEAEYREKEPVSNQTEPKQTAMNNTPSPADLQAAENEKLKKAIEKMNEQLPNSEAKYGIHEATNRVMIKLVDKDTQEVIKEIPPEKTLDMIAKCMEMAGVLVDEKL